MAGDLIREVRRAVLIHGKNDPGLELLVPPAQQHPSTVPANPVWPFTRFDAAQSVPLDMSCVEGATVTFLLHAFARDRLDGLEVVETAEDHAARIASAMKLAYHNRRLPLESDVTALIRVRSVRLMIDGGEAGAYHAIVSCEARVLAA